MGAAFAGRCFDTAADAAAAAWSGVGPVVSAGSPPVVSVVEWSGTAWQVSTYQGTAVVGVSAAPSISFSDCNPADAVTDGLALGWLVVSVWAAAWGVNVLRRSLGWGW